LENEENHKFIIRHVLIPIVQYVFHIKPKLQHNQILIIRSFLLKIEYEAQEIIKMMKIVKVTKLRTSIWHKYRNYVH